MADARQGGPLWVALLGLAAAEMRDVPWQDERWQIWGLASRAPKIAWYPRLDVALEIHATAVWQRYARGASQHVADIRALTYRELVLREPHPVLHPATVYPMAEAVALAGGRPYFRSSVDYGIALAVLRGATTLGLWGFSMVNDPAWAWQQPSAEFWLGVAVAHGVDIVLPASSTLLARSEPYGAE